jgi:hypothetical protein
MKQPIQKSAFGNRGTVHSIVGAIKERAARHPASAEPAPLPAAPDVPLATLLGGTVIAQVVDDRSVAETVSRWAIVDQPNHSPLRERGGVLLSVVEPKRGLVAVICADREGGSVTRVVMDGRDPNDMSECAAVGRALRSLGYRMGRHAWRFCAVELASGEAVFLDQPLGRVDFDAPWSIRTTGMVFLPKALASTSDLHFEDCLFVSNPEAVNVAGDLSFAGARGLALPSDMNVGGSLRIRACALEALPPRFRVGRDLDLVGTPIRDLPDSFHVGRHIYAGRTEIRTVPAGLSVGGDLNLKNSAASRLQWGLRVGGTLDLTETGVREIPGDAVIGADLRVEPGTRVPASVSIGGSLQYPTPFGYMRVDRQAS